MAVQRNNTKVNSLMLWVRILLPIVLAALGWYIGQTVGNLEQRLKDIEASDKIILSDFLQHRSKSEAQFEEIMRRLSSHDLTTADIVQMDRFLSKEAAQDRRIERIEDRLNEKKEK